MRIAFCVSRTTFHASYRLTSLILIYVLRKKLCGPGDMAAVPK